MGPLEREDPRLTGNWESYKGGNTTTKTFFLKTTVQNILPDYK
jgi:hypothetical protein